jgi:hypothetical protein
LARKNKKKRGYIEKKKIYTKKKEREKDMSKVVFEQF